MGKGGETTSTSEPKYSPELGPIFGRERELLSNIILPQEQQRIKSLGALGRGDFGQAGQIQLVHIPAIDDRVAQFFQSTARDTRIAPAGRLQHVADRPDRAG